VPAVLPDLYWYKIPKREKMTKKPLNIPNDHKMAKMAKMGVKWT
jgi:hypothetical protein